MKRSITIVVVAICLTLTGCIHRTSSTNPAVVKMVTLLDAENTCNAIAHGLSAADGILSTLRQQEPDFVPAAHIRLASLARLNDQANTAILQAKNGDSAVDWRSALTAVAKASSDIKNLSDFGFKNPQSQQLVQASLATLLQALSLAESFGGH